MTQLTFHGATETVTGSKYLLETDGARVLIDCGLFQGLKHLRLLNWEPPHFDPAKLPAVVLTHAHLDHTGYLPRLMSYGFRGTVYCTPPTEDLSEIILYDSAENQVRDAEEANRRKYSKHHPALPLYTRHDVEQVLRRFRTVPRGEWFSPVDPFWMRYHDAGHLLGSTMIEVEDRSQQPALRILFSGDVGRYDAPLYHDPASPPACDYLICESTYGNREHSPEPILEELRQVMDMAIARGGVTVVAAFSVGRAQQLIYLLQVLIQTKAIPAIPIFLDSPMSVEATDVYLKYAADHDLAEMAHVARADLLGGAGVRLTKTVDESKQLNFIEGPAVIISSSGMMTGGRILHHLKRRLPHPQNTILLGGFMAEGTRGRQLQDGARWMQIHGERIPVRAAVAFVSGLSGHAGRSELLRWLEPLAAPRQVFLTHGELAGATSLAEHLRTARGWNVTIPKLGQTFQL